MPLGKCVTRIAESVLLTCWPPAPDARNVSMRRSAGLSSIGSISSSFRQDRDRHGRSVNAPLGFGRGHSLHAMGAGFELQARERAASDDSADDFLVAAVLAGAFRQHFDAPALVGRRNANTCETNRRRRSPLRRRRCRRALRDRCCSRRARPWERAASTALPLRVRCARSSCPALHCPARAFRDRRPRPFRERDCALRECPGTRGSARPPDRAWNIPPTGRETCSSPR